jgi:ankyrin repeat protein
MSGVELRYVSTHGKQEQLKEYLRLKANPCSVDEFGLSALHYAVWNGHIECVKLLVSNDFGVDSKGKKCSCLNLVSDMGYTGFQFSVL